MNNKELAIQEFLKEKQKRTEFYNKIKEDGILPLFDRIPLFISTIWLTYNEEQNLVYHLDNSNHYYTNYRYDEEQNSVYRLDNAIQYYTNYRYEIPTYFEYNFLKYFSGIGNVDNRDCLRDNQRVLHNKAYQLYDELRILNNEIKQFSFYKIDEHGFDENGFIEETRYVIIQQEFMENVLIPIIRGDYDKELTKKIKQFIMKFNLTD